MTAITATADFTASVTGTTADNFIASVTDITATANNWKSRKDAQLLWVIAFRIIFCKGLLSKESSSQLTDTRKFMNTLLQTVYAAG